jgi:hypothetical protein
MGEGALKPDFYKKPPDITGILGFFRALEQISPIPPLKKGGIKAPGAIKKNHLNHGANTGTN